ncbi:MAG: tyrosine-type recombinase/integrase [Actinomycetes bacterium]
MPIRAEPEDDRRARVDAENGARTLGPTPARDTDHEARHRHTWATPALRAGVHPKVAQERLGHANTAITMDTYSHVMPDVQESPAELVAALVDLSDDDER